jgi:hypothetical protein
MNSTNEKRSECYFDSGIGKYFGETVWKRRIESVLGNKIADSL